MLLLEKKKLFNLKENCVVSFVGYANFIKIDLDTLNSINWFVDGITLSKVFSLLNVNAEKCSFDFTGVADDIFLMCVRKNYKIHFIGGDLIDSETFKTKIQQKYPKLQLSCQDGYKSLSGFDFSGLSEIDICVYGMGSPIQEKLAIKHKNLFRYSYTCGAFITQTARSQRKDYYTPLVIRFQLRWLYRIYYEKGHFMRLFKAFLRMGEIYMKAKKVKFV